MAQAASRPAHHAPAAATANAGALSSLLSSAATAKAPAPPTPARLAEIYADVWFKLGETYIDPARLTNWGEWEHKYDGKLKTEQDLDAALDAMASSLHDTWTGYESSHQKLLEVFAAVRGLVDLGMVLKENEHGDHVVKIAPFGSLARDNGLQAGDQVISINGKALAGLSQTALEEALRVPVTSTVTVVYRVAASAEIGTASGVVGPSALVDAFRTVTFKAVPSTAPLAEARMLANGIMYARLSSFRDGRADIGVLNNSVTALLASCQCNPRGLILDLRGNPGGSFELVLKEAAFFLPGKTIVTSTTREGNLVTSSSYRAERLTSFESAGLSDPQRKMIDVFANSPMVVLVDGSTASAAELITGALKDNKRALVVGVRTFGKGVGFDEIDVPLGGQLTVTKLHYMTPSGFDVSAGGIDPDVVVEQPRADAAAAQSAVPATGAQDLQLAVGLAELEKRISASRP
jgi:carboxyl-terminal processing protease